MAGKDYYNILGVRRDATGKEISQAYRRLARKYHPDVNPTDKTAEAKFKEINAAYEVLSDKENRQKYDQYGDQWQYADRFAEAGRQQPPWDFADSGATSFHFGGDINGLFEEIIRGGRTGTSSRRRVPRRGQDIESAIEVTLEEAYSGSTRNIALQSDELCTSCQGTGHIQNVPCSVCRGSGVARQIKRLEVKIPPGAKDGSRIRIAGKGQPGSNGGSSGDLYLVVSVKPHPLFERRDDDLYVEVAVPLTVAVLGGEVEVPTPKGSKLALKIPPETQNGRIFRLAKQGMPHLGNSSRGDLLAELNVVLPTNLSMQEKELFKKLHELRPTS